MVRRQVRATRFFSALMLSLLVTAGFSSSAVADLFYEVSVSIDGPFLFPGDEVTLGIHAETTQPEAIALGLRAVFDDAALEFVDGAVPDSLFHYSNAIPVGGLPNALSAPRVENQPAGPSVNLFQGIRLGPAAGTGALEGEQFSVTLRVLPGFIGETTVDIGAFVDQRDTYGAHVGDDVLSPIFGDDNESPVAVPIQTARSISLNIVPEPGTALLLGLGLGGLAAMRKRGR